MRVVMDHEAGLGREVYDVSAKNLGYDITSLDLGELRLIAVKGLGASTGNVLLTPNERRVAEDRRDCYWLYVVTDCDASPRLQDPVRDPAGLDWNEVKKVAHYYLSVDAVAQPMELREDSRAHDDVGFLVDFLANPARCFVHFVQRQILAAGDRNQKAPSSSQ